MLNRVIVLLALGGFCLGVRAAILPPEKLLPKDTILMVTAPDSGAGWNLLTNAPYGQLWQDPQFKPFKDKFVDKFSSDVIAPLERNLGVKLSSYQGLAQGQATFAILPMARAEKPDERYARIFLLDTKDHAGQLRANLAEIRQKWAAAGKPMKTEKIRETDFTTLMLSPDDLSWEKIIKPKSALPDEDATGGKSSTNKTELTFGQSDSLLLVSDSVAAIEKVLTRQSGGLLPALEEEPAFQNDFAARLRGAPFYAWVNAKDLIDALTKSPEGEVEDSLAPGGPRRVLDALGLSGVTSACVAYRVSPEGMSAQLFIGAPEAKRHGLFRALAAEAKDSNPPPFVPADAAKFWRWRLNVPHSWSQIETMLNDFNPQVASVINFVLTTAGKEKDEKYDLKAELLGNLGDDIIHYEKAPTGNTLADLNSAPSIYLLGSPNPEKLAAALKNGLSFMGSTKEREFLGRQICTLTLVAQGAAPAKSFSFAGSGGYVALSDNSAILEEYLRSDENKARPLSETPGLAGAAEKVGGMGKGLFGFENQNLSMRSVVETLRLQSVTLQDVLGTTPALGGVNAADEAAKLREWADFTLLPSYDAISKYFYYSVFAGVFTPEGFALNYFSPTPPKLR
jgi:hypothetical protein